MPNRILREGILTSDRVNALSPLAELFYRRLMSIVDDYGRIEAHPSLLLSKCFPFQLDRITEAQVTEWLAECGHLPVNCPSCDGQFLPLVTLYSVGRKKYLQVNDFGQRTRTDSKCPGPDDGQMTVIGQSNVGIMSALYSPTPNLPTTTTTTKAPPTSNECSPNRKLLEPLPIDPDSWDEQQFRKAFKEFWRGTGTHLDMGATEAMQQCACSPDQAGAAIALLDRAMRWKAYYDSRALHRNLYDWVRTDSSEEPPAMRHQPGTLAARDAELEEMARRDGRL